MNNIQKLIAAGYSESDAEDFADEFEQGGTKVPQRVKDILTNESVKSKMKKRKLKEMIKAAFIAEITDADEFFYSPVKEEDLDEMIANLDEADDEEPIEDIIARITGTPLAEAEGDEEETDVEVDAEEETTDGGEEKNDSIVVDKKIVSLSSLPQETRKILDSLETLRAQAEEFGDQKFITQVGNTITFFTRDFVVAGDEPTRAKVDESVAFPLWNRLNG